MGTFVLNNPGRSPPDVTVLPSHGDLNLVPSASFETKHVIGDSNWNWENNEMGWLKCWPLLEKIEIMEAVNVNSDLLNRVQHSQRRPELMSQQSRVVGIWQSLWWGFIGKTNQPSQMPKHPLSYDPQYLHHFLFLPSDQNSTWGCSAATPPTLSVFFVTPFLVFS